MRRSAFTRCRSLVARAGSTWPAVTLATLMLVTIMAAARAQTAPPVDPRVGCEQAQAVPQPDLGEPDNIDFFKKRLLYYRCAAYEADVARVLADARTWVAARASQVQRPAIVLDIDETSLTNWPRIYQDDYAYFPSFPGNACDFTRSGNPCGDLDWQQSGWAMAIVPTLELYKVARCIDQPPTCSKIDVFFVTGRREIEHHGELPSAWTLRNLTGAGYLGIERDHLYTRDPASSGSVANHKIAARADIEGKGFTIIANIGDQKSDLVGGHAQMTFKVPNPFYFIP